MMLAQRGCKQIPEIHQQTKAKPQDRMLAAMIPVKDQSWFFKITGPRGTIGPLVDTFTSLLQSVEFDEKDEPKWKLPKGWTQKLHPSGMRFATITAGDKDLSLSVNRFPTTDELENVNRWRRQMGLHEYWNEPHMRKEVVSLALPAGKKALLCNFVGTAPKAGGMPPFAGGAGKGGGHPPMTKGSEGNSAAKATRQAPRQSSPRIAFDAPKEWTAEPTGEMRTAAFSVKAGKEQADVTIIDLRHGKEDLKATVDIWRNQLGLEEIDGSQLLKQVTEISVRSGQKGQTIEILGKTQSLIGTLVVNGQLVWVIRLKGSPALVKQERSRFRTFVQSLRFPTKE